MKTIVCYGDSNTWGYRPRREVPPVSAMNRYPWDVRWTGLLQKKLGEHYHVIEEGLNGRTTMFDCPMEDHRNGLKTIDVCLRTSTPFDLIIIMLGTNDTKFTIGMKPCIIAHGIERLIAKVKNQGCGPEGKDPEILVVAPIRMGKGVEKGWLAVEFDAESQIKDEQLAAEYRRVAAANGVHFMDAGERVCADSADYIHMNAEGHAVLADMMYEKVLEILGE